MRGSVFSWAIKLKWHQLVFWGREKSSDAAYGQPLKLLWMSHVIFGYCDVP